MTALADRFRALSVAERDRIVAELGVSLHDVHYDFDETWARDDQLVTPEDLVGKRLVVFGGPRGSGKTAAAIWLFFREIYAGRALHPRIIAGTEGDVTDTILHGPSGIDAMLPPEWQPQWIKSEGHAGVLVCTNGVRVSVLTAGGGQEQAVGGNSDLDLYDDVAKWGPRTEQMWNHCRASCRIGRGLGIVATTKRGSHVLRRLLKAGEMPRVLLRRPTDVRANKWNLTFGHFDQVKGETSADFFDQEMADEDVSEQSPFVNLDFEAAPIRVLEPTRAELSEIVVVVDPAEGKGPAHDEWGIGAIARVGNRVSGRCVALDDASNSFNEDEAADRALALCREWGVTKIVCESNRGPRVQSAIKAAYWKHRAEALENGATTAPPMPEIVPVRAADNKRLRAGPLKSLYKQGRLGHVAGLGKLEKQQREWDPDGPKRPKQDDRIDWLVHGVHHLLDLGDVREADPGEQLTGLAGKVEATQTKANELRTGDPNKLSELDPRHPQNRARTLWGVAGGSGPLTGRRVF